MKKLEIYEGNLIIKKGNDADYGNLKEKSDILVLKVVANIENDIFKLHSSEDRTNQRLLMRIED